MQLEVGKYYRTSGGYKAEVIGDDHSDADPMLVNHGNMDLWHDRDGKCNVNSAERDIIAEWTDEPSQPILSDETIDHIAIDSLRHHYATEMEPLQKEAFRIVLRYYGVTV